MNTPTANEYMNLHDQMVKARRSNQYNEELRLLGELSDMWYVMSDADQDIANEMIKERAYQQHG